MSIVCRKIFLPASRARGTRENRRKTHTHARVLRKNEKNKKISLGGRKKRGRDLKNGKEPPFYKRRPRVEKEKFYRRIKLFVWAKKEGKEIFAKGNAASAAEKEGGNNAPFSLCDFIIASGCKHFILFLQKNCNILQKKTSPPQRKRLLCPFPFATGRACAKTEGDRLSL